MLLSWVAVRSTKPTRSSSSFSRSEWLALRFTVLPTSNGYPTDGFNLAEGLHPQFFDRLEIVNGLLLHTTSQFFYFLLQLAHLDRRLLLLVYDHIETVLEFHHSLVWGCIRSDIVQFQL